MIAGLDQSIEAGVGYLQANQKPSGQFRVWNSPHPQFVADSTPEDSVFATSCILYNLEWLHSPVMKQVRKKALEFLRTEGSNQGLYRYYAFSSQAKMGDGQFPLPFTIPFDVDTTSCVSLILRRHGIELDNKNILRANRDEAGCFLTWLMEEPFPKEESGFPFICLMPTENSTCVGVNANAVCYLGESETTRAAVQSMIESVCRGTHLQESSYYADELVLFYFYSRAYFEGVRSLVSVRQPIIERLLSRQKQNGSFGTAQQTAMALCAIMNFDNNWPGKDTALQSLIVSQNPDGSWPCASFYVGNPAKVTMKHYLCLGGVQRELPPVESEQEGTIKHFGSEEITTAYCLEALSRMREAHS